MESKDGEARMKYLAVLFMLIALSKDGYANQIYLVPQPQQVIVQQPVVITQTMVYQAPQVFVTVPVPVVVYPQPIIDQRIYWGYPYYTTTPMPVIQHRHRCWNY
jgi:hypothetical protein